jgi:hypothetical protein
MAALDKWMDETNDFLPPSTSFDRGDFKADLKAVLDGYLP